MQAETALHERNNAIAAADRIDYVYRCMVLGFVPPSRAVCVAAALYHSGPGNTSVLRALFRGSNAAEIHVRCPYQAKDTLECN